MYTRVGTHGGRPLYSRDQGTSTAGKYIYYWNATKHWRISVRVESNFNTVISSKPGVDELDAHLVLTGSWSDHVGGADIEQNPAIRVKCATSAIAGPGQRFVKEAGAACGSGNDIGLCGVFGFSREVLEEACLADVNCVAYSTWGYKGGPWCMKSKYTPGVRMEGHDCYVKQGRVPAHAHGSNSSAAISCSP